MKGARNVLVLKWKQFSPHRPLKGTQTPRDPQIFRELQRWDTEVMYIQCYAEVQEENTRTLTFIFIFKLRLSFMNILCMNLCWYPYPLGCQSWTTTLSWRKSCVTHLSGELATPFFSHWKFLCMDYCMFYLLIARYGEFKSDEDTLLSIFFLNLFMFIFSSWSFPSKSI